MQFGLYIMYKVKRIDAPLFFVSIAQLVECRTVTPQILVRVQLDTHSNIKDNNMTSREASMITTRAIENTEEYKYIMRKIRGRAELGYDYIRIDGDTDLYSALVKYSIFSYLQSLGYTVSYRSITW